MKNNLVLIRYNAATRPSGSRVNGYANQMSDSVRKIDQLLQWREDVLSLDAPIGEELDNLYGVVPTPLPSPEQKAVEREYQDVLQDLFYDGKLRDTERDVLTRRYLNEPFETLEQVARQYNVSRERIRQIEGKAIRKLRWAAQKNGLFLDDLF